MTKKSHKSVIIGLIRDSLINLKLINGLISSGLEAHDYRISICDAVFILMGFKNSRMHDLIYDNVYLAIAQKVKDIDFPVSMKKLNELSEIIYSELLFAKEICDINDEQGRIAIPIKRKLKIKTREKKDKKSEW